MALITAPPPSRSYAGSSTRRTEAELLALIRRCRHDKVLFSKMFFGLNPTPWQREVLAQNGRVDTTVAGRRTGKTTVKAIQCVHDLATRGPNRIGYVGGPSLDQAEQYIREIEAAADRSPYMHALLKGGPQKGISRREGFPTVDFVTGGTLHCRATVQEGRYLRGKGANFVVLTEAAFIADTVYDRAVRALVLDRHGDIHLDSSPNGDNYVKATFDRASEAAGQWARTSRNGYYTATHGTVYDNPRLSREDIAAIQAEVPDWVWRTEYLAEFIEDGAAVFAWETLVDLFDYDYGHQAGYIPGHRYVMGLDLAQVHDYTSLTVLDVSSAPYEIAYWDRYRGRPYTGPHSVVEDVVEVRERFGRPSVYVDATNERAVAEQIPGAVEVVFTPAIRDGMLSHLGVMAQHRALKLPASYTTLRDEMRALRHVRVGQTRVRADHPSNGFDDTVWSLCLALKDVDVPGQRGQSDSVNKLREAKWF